MKIGIPLHTPVLLYKSGVQRGIHYTNMFSWGERYIRFGQNNGLPKYFAFLTELCCSIPLQTSTMSYRVFRVKI